MIFIERAVNKDGFGCYNINVDVSDIFSGIKEVWYEADFIAGGGSMAIRFYDNVRIDAVEQVSGKFTISNLIHTGTDAHLYVLDNNGNKAETKVDWDSFQR